MIPLILALIGAEAIERIIKLREYIIFTLQDLAEEGLFYSWILYDAGVVDELDTAIEWLDKVAKAYIYVVGLPLIVARFGEEINQTPHLYEFFRQFPSAREHLQQIEIGITTYINKVDKELIENLTKLYPFDKPSEQEVEEMETNALAFFDWIKRNIETLWNAMNQDPFKFVNYCVQNLSQTVYPEFLYNLPGWLVFMLMPFIDIDWVVIKTCITLKWALEHFKLSTLADKIPRPYIKGMKANLFHGETEIATTEVGADGSLNFQGTITDKELKDLFVFIHGLILPIPIAEISRKFYIEVQDTGETVHGYETEWIKIQLLTLPDMTKAFIIAFEDMKGTSNPDYDYNDVIIYVLERETDYYCEVYGTKGTYENHLYHVDFGFICKCPKEQEGTSDQGIFEETGLCAKFTLDKETLNIISIEVFT